jgi:hypothetical protein
VKRVALAGAAIVILWGCATKASEWIPMDTATRATLYWQNVEYLEAPPGPERPYTVVGIITPIATFATEAEAIDYLRRMAAEHGADAIFLESRTTSSDLSADWWSLGSSAGANYRAKAIAWGNSTP